MQATTDSPVPVQNDEAGHAARHKATVVCLSKLPPFHAAAIKLLNISSESGSAMRDFEMVFRGDPALTADLLLVANSVLFGNRAQVASIRHALAHLGLDRVRSLASTIALSFFVRNQPRTAYVRQIWAHSIATAVIAEALGEIYQVEDLYTAGLVHELGRLGLLLSMGATYENWISAELESVEQANKLEESRFGMDHCDAGALVGKKWGFPETLRKCMVEHHHPKSGREGDPVSLVHLACRMADGMGYPEIHYCQAPEMPAMPEKVRGMRTLMPEQLHKMIAMQLEAIGS